VIVPVSDHCAALNHFINDFLEVGRRVRRYRFGNHSVERLLAELPGILILNPLILSRPVEMPKQEPAFRG